jgi:hypothetical protein
MSEITIKISEGELKNVVEAYRTLQNFLEKIISPNELYTDEFLQGLREAESDVEGKKFSEVKDFADFIQ